MVDDEQTTDGKSLSSVVGENVRSRRAALGWSLGELARRASVGKATLSGLELGDADPSLETLVSISGAV